MPEDHWDATAGKIKDDTKFGEWVSGNAAAVAAQRSRELTLPQRPEDYKIGTSANFKPPEGLEFKIDDKDPMWSQAQAWAKKHGLSQDAFNEAIDLVAGRDIGTSQSIKAAYDAEVGKLGTAGQARVDAVAQWLGAVAGDSAKPLMTALKLAPVADTIVAFEKLIKTFSSQGVTPFSQAHRVEPDTKGKIPGYENMTFEQRRFEQDKRRAAGGRS